jgi:hypothetical protein
VGVIYRADSSQFAMRAVAAGTVVAAILGLTTACLDHTTRGAAVPATTLGPTPTSTTGTTTETTTAQPTTTAPPPPVTLGPRGFGDITLGMTKSAALATGELVINDPSSEDHCTGYDLTAFPTPPEEASVYISPTSGVVAIFAATTMRTPEGIGLGSTLASVKATYPEVGRQDPKPDDPEYLPAVPGNPQARYRISFDGTVVAGLGIEQLHEDCFD